MRAKLIAGARYKRHNYGTNHPLAIPRVSLTCDLIRAYDALRDDEYIESRMATSEELGWFHTEEYVSAIQRCESDERVSDIYRKRHNIGNFENPYFPGFFSTPATATGGSIQAAEQLLKGYLAFSPAGGMHHALPDQANGFCFFNDVVLCIKRLRQERMRVLYLDIDAHHGDGVEFAFANDADTFTFSLHMDTQYAYPFRGGEWKTFGANNNVLNVPLPKQTNDEEYQLLFDALFPAVVKQWQPDAIVLQAGTDILFPDPLGKLQISTQGFLSLIEKILQFAPRNTHGVPQVVVLGGGGYHPLALARCWTGVWALLSERELPDALPAEAQSLLREVDWDHDEDEHYFENFFARRLDHHEKGSIRPEVNHLLQDILTTHPVFAKVRKS